MALSIPTRAEFEVLRRQTRKEDSNAFAAVEEQVRYMVDAVNAWSPRRRRLSRYKSALLLHWGQATYIVVHGIVPVCEGNAGDLAIMLARALYETMLSAYWMSMDPDARVVAFDRFAARETRELHLLLVELGLVDASELPDMDLEKEAALKDEFPKTYLGWTKCRLGEIEKDVVKLSPEQGKEEFRRWAKTIRGLGNRHTHVSPGEIVKRRCDNEGGAEVTIGPTRRGRDCVPMTLKLAAWAYGQLVDLVIEHTKLADLSRWRAHHRRSMLRTLMLTEAQRQGVTAKAPCPCGSRWKYGRCHGQRSTA